MIKIENHCVGCDIPCIDCGRKAVEVYYCDKCGDELDEVYEDDGEHLCEEHLLERYRKRLICTGCGEEIDGDVYGVEDDLYCEYCLLEKFLKEF